MYYPSLYTNPDGTINEELKAKLDKSNKRYSDNLVRRKKRIQLVNDRLNPVEYFTTDVSKNKMKEVPTILYEPGNGLYNLIDYLNKAVEHFTDKSYSYSEHKKTVTEFVKYFNIKPSQEDLIERIRIRFEDESGNVYSYKTLWFYLCRWCLRQEKDYHRFMILNKLKKEI